jgi:hypothetical protein
VNLSIKVKKIENEGYICVYVYMYNSGIIDLGSFKLNIERRKTQIEACEAGILPCLTSV